MKTPKLIRYWMPCITMLLLVASAVPVKAQPAVAKPPPTSFRFMSWEQSVNNLLVSSDEKTFSPVHIPPNTWGRNVDLNVENNESRVLRLYQQTQREGKTVHEIVAETPLPKDCFDFQIAVLRQSGAQPYRLVMMPNDPKVFPAGTVRAFNFSPHPAIIKINDEIISLAALEWRAIPITADRKHRVSLTTALHVTDTWVTAGRDILFVRPNHRGELTLFYTAGAAGEYIDPLAPGTNARALTITATQYAPPPAGG